MKALVKLASLSFMVGCGVDQDNLIGKEKPPQTSDCRYENTVTGSVDELLLEKTKLFFQEAHERGTKCWRISSIEMKPDASIAEAMGNYNSVAYCEMNFKYIAVAEQYWSYMDDTSRMVLMFHELGHCALGLDHAPRGSINIMNPHVLPTDVADQNREILLEKLFSRSLL